MLLLPADLADSAEDAVSAGLLSRGSVTLTPWLPQGAFWEMRSRASVEYPQFQPFVLLRMLQISRESLLASEKSLFVLWRVRVGAAKCQ